MDDTNRLGHLKFRAWHRGTREADYMIGCFFDAHHHSWDVKAISWFEALLDEDDVVIIAWALGTQPVPEAYAGALMDAFRKLDFVEIPR